MAKVNEVIKSTDLQSVKVGEIIKATDLNNAVGIEQQKSIFNRLMTLFEGASDKEQAFKSVSHMFTKRVWNSDPNNTTTPGFSYTLNKGEWLYIRATGSDESISVVSSTYSLKTYKVRYDTDTSNNSYLYKSNNDGNACMFRSNTPSGMYAVRLYADAVDYANAIK